MTSVAVLLFLINTFTVSPQNEDDYSTDAYSENVRPINNLHQSLPHRKLSNFDDNSKSSPPEHLHFYDLSFSLPSELNYIDCVNTTVTPSFQICLYNDWADIFISAGLRSSGIWEPYITDIYQKALHKYPDAVVIDIGANIGYYSLMAARMGHRVIAVEPVYDNILRFHKSAHIGKFADKISLLYNALSDKIENVTISENIDNQGGIHVKSLDGLDVNKLVENNEHAIVGTTTLNHLLKVMTFSQAIIKVDIGKHGYHFNKQFNDSKKKILKE